MRKTLSILLTIALIITLLPATFLSKVEAAQGTYFIFNEQYDPDSPRIVNKDSVNITGTLNSVSSSSIYYSVYQLTADKQETSNKRENIQEGMTTSASTISVVNLKLFPGLNKVTFKGRNGNTDVTESIYFEYRDSPMLYDVKASLSGKSVDLSEDKPAVVIASRGSTFFEKDTADISINGFAPGAETVTVQVNGTTNSWTYPVNSYNNHQFYASPINIRSGKNLITIIVKNKNQTIETTREITFYNGKTTFYDVVLEQGSSKSPDLSTNPDFSGDTGQASTITGKLIVPQDPNLPVTKPSISYTLSGGGSGTGTVLDADITMLNDTTAITDGYLEVEFSLTLPSGTFSYDQLSFVSLSTPSGSKTFGITFRDATKSFIHKVNYLSGYTGSMTENQVMQLTGTDLGINKNVYSLPAAFEILVANGGQGETVTVSSDGNAATVASLLSTYPIVTENINGVPTSLTRIIIKVENLYKFGEQTLEFKLGSGATMSVPITLLYGPSVKFDKLFEGTKVYLDPMDPQLGATVLGEMGDFSGELLNIANAADIKYSGTDQTVFLYVNNTLIGLIPNGSATKFIIDPADKTKAFNALMLGANNIKFEYKGKNTYTMNIKVNYIPKDSPMIPANDNDGVYPFSYVNMMDNLPAGKDNEFEENGSVYLTKKREMNVYGTFNFIKGLGSNISDVTNNINALTSKSSYILKVTTPEINGQTNEYKWDLNKELIVVSSNTPIGTINQGVKDPSSGLLDVYYDVDKQYFKFMLRDQKIPTDGSPRVYSISVYNAGEGGAAATYRLEVTPITEPFSVIRPLPQKRIVNQNFVEVIVYSENGSKVMVGKEEAEKTTYNDYSSNTSDPLPVFRAIVKDLKANKDTKINIAVTIGDEVITDYITVRYVPANIPGGQYMETMKSSHKVFEGALTLKFDKGTSLIRRDYNKAENLKGQVYTGHDLLFSIANSEDGIVDRHDFEILPPNYDNMVNEGVGWFNLSFPRRFVKSSPVFWIDAGLADDPATTAEYDPVTYGSDPYQYRNVKAAMFYNRDELLELIPSKRAELTLTYDASIAQDTGRLITVFYYNPELKQWENLGGVVDAKKHTIKVPFDRFGYYVVGKLSYSYNDINQHQYARDYIETVFAKGIMNPFDPALQFGADTQYVSRGEFTRMIVKAMNIPLNYLGTQHFSDLDSDVDNVNTNALWDFRYIETAARAGITRGVRPQAFDPISTISRQDAAVMIAKALNLKLETDRSKIEKDLIKYYKDYSSIDYYAQSAVLAVTKKGFMQGTPIDTQDPKRGSMFNPTSSMLRGDAAILIAKVMADQKLLPKIQ